MFRITEDVTRGALVNGRSIYDAPGAAEQGVWGLSRPCDALRRTHDPASSTDVFLYVYVQNDSDNDHHPAAG